MAKKNRPFSTKSIPEPTGIAGAMGDEELEELAAEEIEEPVIESEQEEVESLPSVPEEVTVSETIVPLGDAEDDAKYIIDKKGKRRRVGY